MAGALATIAANLAPSQWTKTTSAEENSTSFEKWINQYERWESIACGGLGHTDTQRWNLLLASGGSDLKDILLHQAKVQIKDIPRVDPVEGRDEIPEIPEDAENGIVGQAYQAAIQPVIGRPGEITTPWEQGIQMIKDSVTKYSNQVMARNKLWHNMRAGKYSDWRKWAQELLLQAKRCNWVGYGAEQAALDAMLYQCPTNNGRIA